MESSDGLFDVEVDLLANLFGFEVDFFRYGHIESLSLGNEAQIYINFLSGS